MKKKFVVLLCLVCIGLGFAGYFKLVDSYFRIRETENKLQKLEQKYILNNEPQIHGIKQPSPKKIIIAPKTN